MLLKTFCTHVLFEVRGYLEVARKETLKNVSSVFILLVAPASYTRVLESGCVLGSRCYTNCLKSEHGSRCSTSELPIKFFCKG